jgi:hypothetical protein
MDYHICLAKPSRLEECAGPMFNTMIWGRAMTNPNTVIAKVVTPNTVEASPHGLANIA